MTELYGHQNRTDSKFLIIQLLKFLYTSSKFRDNKIKDDTLENLYIFKLKIQYLEMTELTELTITELFGHENRTNSKFLQTNNITNSFH